MMRGDYRTENFDREKCELIVSACLAGFACRYDGESRVDDEIADMCRTGLACPVCPEELGGLPTPRPMSEIESGSGEDVLDGKASVIDREGRDVSAFFVEGANMTLQIARELGIKKAILKALSPSCGLGQIYRDSKLVEGNGVCAALLLRNGFSITCR